MTDYTANSGSSLTTLFANRSSSDPSLNYLTGYENTAGVDFSDLFLPLLPWNTAISNTNYEYNGNDLAKLFNPADGPTLPFVIDITSTTGGWTYFLGNSVVGLENSFTIVIADYESSPPSLSSPKIGSNTVSAKMTFLNPDNIQNFNAIICGGGGYGSNNGGIDDNTGGGGQGGYGGQIAVNPLSKFNLNGYNFDSSSYMTITVGAPDTSSLVSIVFADGFGYSAQGSAGAGGSNNGPGGSGGGSEDVVFTGNPTMITDVWGGGNGANGSSVQTGSDGWKPTIVNFTAGTDFTPSVNFGGGGSAGSVYDPTTNKPTGAVGGTGGGGGIGGIANWPNGVTNPDTINNFVNGIYYAKTSSASSGLNGTGGGGAGESTYINDELGNFIYKAGSGIVIFQFQVAGWTPPANFPTTGSGGPGSG